MEAASKTAAASASAGASSKRAAEKASENNRNIKTEAPRAKRQRVSRACDQCRAERACTYATQAKKRGIQPGYIRTLELSIAWLFSKYPNAEILLKKELAVENGQVQRLLTGKDASGSDRLHNHWSKSLVYKQIDQLLSGSEVVSPFQNEGEEGAEEGDGNLIDLFNPEGIVTANAAGEDLNVTSSDPSSGFPSTRGGKSPQNYPSPSVLKPPFLLPLDFWKLLDVYYAFTHAWLPISEKHDILKTAYSYPPEGAYLLASAPGSGSHAELWAILALTAHQTDPRKDQVEIDRYMTTSRDLIPLDSGPFEIGHLKAILLLTLIYIGRSCFILESIIGKKSCLPTHLRSEDVAVLGFLEEDGLEEWNPWDGGASDASQGHFAPPRQPAQTLSIFNHLVRVLQGQKTGLFEAQSGHQADPRRTTLLNASGSIHSDTHRTSKSAQGRAGPGDSHRRSSQGQQNSPSNNALTPQHLHLRVITHWMETIGQAGKSNTQTMMAQWIEQYVRTFGSATVPPTLVCALGSLSDDRGATSQDMHIRNMITSISATWTRLPITAPYAQNTATMVGQHLSPLVAGQHLSPASITFDPPRPSVQRQNTAENNGTAATAQQFNAVRDNRVNDTTFFQPITTSLGIQSSSAIPHIGIPTNTDGSSPNISQMQHQSIAQTSAPTFYPAPPHEGQPSDLDAIFEEIAMLDGVRQDDDRPQFMRNLGLGPDLDLSAFFGTDYQPSDPLYTYLHTNSFGQPLNDENNMYPGS
ncbi:hypothetical protein MBLNU459_g7584t1 [Dothideomycetes sp. NU459]